MITARRILFSLALCAMFSLSSQATTIFVGTDMEDFGGGCPGCPPGAVDRLGVVTVNGANFVTMSTVYEGFFLNGLGDGPGFLYAGQALTNQVTEIDYNGNPIGGFTAAVPNGPCCNEEMQLVGNTLYHAHYLNEIEQLNPVTGAAVGAPISQPDVVGMANVNGTVWISHWAGRTVGEWDPVTNIYTPVFSTPSNAGGIAFDPASNILWVGLQGGFIVPYTLTGVALNAGFQPFGNDPDTIDGLTVLGEGTQASVPEPTTMLMVGSGIAAIARFRKRKTA